jgi:hypothetical protein
VYDTWGGIKNEFYKNTNWKYTNWSWNSV